MPVETTFLERIAAGDPSAVDGCLEKYRGLVWSMARRFLGNRADAEDAVQDIFIDLWLHAGRFDSALAPESAFIATVARRRLIDKQRRSGRRQATVPLIEEPAVASSTAERLENLEESQHTRRLFDRLRPPERQVLELSFDSGLSQQEIAEATKLPLGTVKTHTRRGLQRLRQLLESSGPAASSPENTDLPRQVK
jgi:RNA polymerase sigma factor (sigma-70 family)